MKNIDFNKMNVYGLKRMLECLIKTNKTNQIETYIVSQKGEACALCSVSLEQEGSMLSLSYASKDNFVNSYICPGLICSFEIKKISLDHYQHQFGLGQVLFGYDIYDEPFCIGPIF